MIKELKNIIDKDDNLLEDDFKKTAQQLISKQFLYRAKSRHRQHYLRIVEYQDYFSNLMETLNYTLRINEQHGYAGIVSTNFTTRMSLEETLSILVLRLIYDDKMRSFEIEDDGSVVVDETEYTEVWERETRREKQNMTDFMKIAKIFIDKGLIEINVNKEANNIVEIKLLPTLHEVLDGNALERLAAYIKVENEDEMFVEENDEDEMIEGS